jgi:hypothetical protein
MTIMNECRHNALGIDRFVTWIELFARKNVDWNFFERQSFEPKGNSHPK